VASCDKIIRKQGTAGKRNYVILISQKLEIIRRLKHGKSQSIVMTSYNIGSSTVCDKETRGPVTVIFGIKCEVWRFSSSDRH
jgi:hypothetical protein